MGGKNAVQLKHEGTAAGRVRETRPQGNDYFTKMINNVKIASDSMNARPRTSSV